MVATVSFRISRWSAWAPGLSTPEEWSAWAANDAGLAGEESPKVPELPALVVRRASRADRIALRAAFDCCAGITGPLPTVFASRHGEVHRSLELLEALAKEEALSPTSFSLSVHNAAAGLFSIGRKDRSPSTSLAAGLDSLPMAVLEAAGMLAEGAPRVLVVAQEEPLPPPFQPYVAEREPCAAVALLLEPLLDPAEAPSLEPAAAGASLSLELIPGRTAGENTGLEHGYLLPFLRFLGRGQEGELELLHGARGWRWRRTA